MNIHEYQAKTILSAYGVCVPLGIAALNLEEANKAIDQIAKSGIVVVKAQIHAGGRGKGGGVKVCSSAAEAKNAAEKMLGMNLVTHQTGPEGQTVRRLYIESGSKIKKELYLSLVMDRQMSRFTFIASTEGGMDIEEVAASHPEKIIKTSIDPTTGMSDFHIRNIAFGLHLAPEQAKQLGKIMRAMYQIALEKDVMQIEINPLIEDIEGKLIALDAKFNFDENAIFRHEDIAALRDESEENPLELEASKHSPNYIKMDGNIGCMVNGAGLAMASMDIIKLYGGEPANFLDVGGTADAERVMHAFNIIMSDKKVEGILINIFGGIMRCDVIAEGVVEAAKKIGINIPVVLRLEGTNAQKGREILEKSGFKLIPAENLADAASKIVAEIKNNRRG